jgi:photoactive yellow protein
MPFEQQLAEADMISQQHTADDAARLVQRVLVGENISPGELDELPFGAIQLDRRGIILQYNSYESELSGVSKERAIGKQFFTEIAPCTNVKEFYGRFQQGVARKKLHEKFRYHFSFKINPRDVTITLFYSEITESIWVFVRPA